MSHKMLGKCPVCDTDLTVTRLHCSNCETEVSGEFDPCDFCRLDQDQEKLVAAFLKTRGNIREVERELGISYPTVRARLDDVLKVLGLTPKYRTRASSGVPIQRDPSDDDFEDESAS